MSYQTRWLAEPRILFVQVFGTITVSEVAEANDAITDVLNKTRAPVYVIADITNLRDYPRIASDLQGVLRSFYHPRLAASYLYGVASPAVNIILRILTRVSPFEYHIVLSLDEALVAIEKQEPALGPSIEAIDRSAWA